MEALTAQGLFREPSPEDVERSLSLVSRGRLALSPQPSAPESFSTPGPMRIEADIAIVGSGFAGALTALALRSRGRTVVLVERGRHPRFAIGESSTPLANLLLEELADTLRPAADSRLLEVGHVAAIASRRRRRPQARLHVLLPSPRRAPSRTTTTRAAADGRREPARRHRRHALVSSRLRSQSRARSRGRGRDLSRRHARSTVSAFDGGRASLDGTGRATRSTSTRRSSIDASGPRGFLHRALGLSAPPLRWLPPTQGLYTHFEGVARWDRAAAGPPARPYPRGRCGAASRVPWRLDLGAAVCQRHHERRRGADRRTAARDLAR